jgi:solute carrier family 25 (mitochondrial carnitine/acylcarnitine transporter), member 20/29
MANEGISRSQVPGYKQLAYGALSGYVLWMCIYPIDAIKSKLQTDAFLKSERAYSGSWDCFRKTVKVQGYRGSFFINLGLYKGFGACMLRAGPANGATFAAYELAMNVLGR